MITLIIALTLGFINANFSEYLSLEGKPSDLENYNSFISSFENEKPFFACSTEAVILTNLINLAHKNLFSSLYSSSNLEGETSKVQATNILEALDKNHNPSSLHYAFLIGEALKTKNFNVKFFKLYDHFGIYYKYKDSNEALYWSIISHTLEEGFISTAGCFVDIYNEKKITNIDGTTCATTEDLALIEAEDIMSSIKDQVAFYKKSIEPVVSVPIQEELIITEFTDNPLVSIFFNGDGEAKSLEIVDTKLRTDINSYVVADKDKIRACINQNEGSIFLKFKVKDAKAIFDDEKYETSKTCLEDLFNTRMLPLIKDPFNLSVAGIFS